MEKQRGKKSKSLDTSMRNVIYDTFHGIFLFTFVILYSNFTTESKSKPTSKVSDDFLMILSSNLGWWNILTANCPFRLHVSIHLYCQYCPLSIKTASRIEMRPQLEEWTEGLKHSEGYPIKWFYNDKTEELLWLWRSKFAAVWRRVFCWVGSSVSKESAASVFSGGFYTAFHLSRE